jgi:ArsR family transcriptional regulator
MEAPMTLRFEPLARNLGSRCCDDANPARLTTDVAQKFTDDLLILAHPIRIQILTMLARSDGQVCVCDLEVALPVKQPTVSHHLKLLRDAGLIDCERYGLFVYYFLKRDVLAELRSRILEPLDHLA